MSTRNLATETNLRRDRFVDIMAAGSASTNTAAWIAAGYSANGANAAAARALARPAIKEAIANRRRELAEISKRSPSDVVVELWRLAKTADSDAAQVSALRTLADIYGLSAGNQQQLPAAMATMIQALRQLNTPPVATVTMLSPGDDENDGNKGDPGTP